MIALSRRYWFPAAHVLASPVLSAAENARIYGKCANPNGHGHDYGIEVTVSGPLDAQTGRVVAPERLDALVTERVIDRFGHRLLNELEEFEGVVPTAENLALAIHRELEPALAPIALLRVRVIETRRNHFDVGEVA